MVIKLKVKHNLKPIYDEFSQILILGSMPSVVSRKLNFYYAHPQNRFWLVLEKVFQKTITDKEKFLLENHIALWDVLASCEIKGSSDSSIKQIKVNNLNKILKSCNIKQIFITGSTAYKLYNKYLSSANARFSLNDLVEKYQVIKDYLD